MKVLLLLLVCASAYALPRYKLVPHFDEDSDDDVEVDDEPYDEMQGMFTFPTGGPGGPPSNEYLGSSYGRADLIEDDDDTDFYDSNYPILFVEDDEPTTGIVLARALPKKSKPTKAVKDEEDEDEDEEDDADQEDEDDADDDSGFSVPDFNELFPNPEGRPRGPNDYGSYMKHYPTQSIQKPTPHYSQQQPARQYSQRPAPQYRRQAAPPPPQYSQHSSPPPQYSQHPSPPPQQYSQHSSPPPQQYSQHSSPPPPQYRYQPAPPPPEQQYGPSRPSSHRSGHPRPSPNGPPPPRRYRLDLPTEYEGNDIDDSVIIDAISRPEYRMVDEDQEDEMYEDGAADDDVDWSVPSYDELFPAPGNKPPVYGGMKTTWNRPAAPPRGRRIDRDSRFIRLFHSPLHDPYNPEYVINPSIALERRNERMKQRYNNPRWQYLNAYNPDHKPILSSGHWGNPREHDYNPVSRDHYLGGIYNGKNYY